MMNGNMVPHPCGVVMSLGQRETSPQLVQGKQKDPPTSELQIGFDSVGWIFSQAFSKQARQS